MALVLWLRSFKYLLDATVRDKDVEIYKLAGALGDSESQPSPLHGTY